MSLEMFEPPLTPSVGSSDKPEFKVLQADFGDGYTQATAQLNSVRSVLTLKWEALPVSYADQIAAFVKAHVGTIPFLYTPPGETTALQWTCAEYEAIFVTSNIKSVTMTLRQNFGFY